MHTKLLDANVKLQRAYETPAREDGKRILVDRLWPRGIKKDTAAINRRMKELAPSTDLRKWFGHEPKRWPEFKRRYTRELRQHASMLQDLQMLARLGPITLVFAARDEAHNEAVVLRDVLVGS